MTRRGSCAPVYHGPPGLNIRAQLDWNRTISRKGGWLYNIDVVTISREDDLSKGLFVGGRAFRARSVRVWCALCAFGARLVRVVRVHLPTADYIICSFAGFSDSFKEAFFLQGCKFLTCQASFDTGKLAIFFIGYSSVFPNEKDGLDLSIVQTSSQKPVFR